MLRVCSVFALYTHRYGYIVCSGSSPGTAAGAGKARM